MAVTIQSIVDLSRLDFNDDLKVRYLDSDLLKYCNDAIAKILVMRPDINWGNYANAYTDLALTDNFPLLLEYRRPVAAYITAMAETSDDPFAIAQRAEQGLKEFVSGIGLGA